MNITFDNLKYNIHTVDKNNYSFYNNILDLEHLNICNKNVISKSYEFFSYASLEEDGYLGFFITDLLNDINIYASLIVDINCSQIREKVYDNIDNSVEVVLLCSNFNKRISGLTSVFFEFVIKKYNS